MEWVSMDEVDIENFDLENMADAQNQTEDWVYVIIKQFLNICFTALLC